MRSEIRAFVLGFAVATGSAVAAQNMPAMKGMNHMADMQSQMQQCMTMMKDGLGPADKEYDKRFIDMMIPHHQGAVDMATDALKKAQHPELRQLAHNIIRAQEKEISQMKTWRKEWYGTKS